MSVEVQAIDVRGLKELESKLVELGAAVGVRVLRAAIRRAAQPIIRSMQSLAPFDENDTNGYHLRDSIGLNIEPRRRRRYLVQFRLGARRQTVEANSPEARAGYRIIGGLSRSSRSPIYDLVAENNTPFIRPGFDQNVGRFLVTFRRELTRGIERAARRQAKSLARAVAEDRLANRQ